MSEIKSQIITFSQLRSHNYQICDDRYGIAAYVLTRHRIAAGLNCPFNTDDKSSFYFVNVDNVVASRTQMFGTNLCERTNYFLWNRFIFRDGRELPPFRDRGGCHDVCCEE